MRLIDEITDVREANLVIANFDINGFRHLSSALSASELFDFMSRYRDVLTEGVNKANGFVVRFLADIAITVFEDNDVDDTFSSLMALKEELDTFTKSKGFDNTVKLSLNVGTVAIGYMGKDPNRYIDIHGKALNFGPFDIRCERLAVTRRAVTSDAAVKNTKGDEEGKLDPAKVFITSNMLDKVSTSLKDKYKGLFSEAYTL